MSVVVSQLFVGEVKCDDDGTNSRNMTTNCVTTTTTRKVISRQASALDSFDELATTIIRIKNTLLHGHQVNTTVWKRSIVSFYSADKSDMPSLQIFVHAATLIMAVVIQYVGRF